MLGNATGNTCSATYRRGSGWADLPEPDASTSIFILAFGASTFAGEAAPFTELAERFPHATIVGCSTAGEISGDELRDESITAGVFTFKHSRIATASASVDTPASSRAAGVHLAGALLADDLRAVLVFSDGLQVNGSELVRGINEVTPEHVVVTGGLAGDGTAFERTWVLDDGIPVQGRVVAVGLYGAKLRIGTGSAGGWQVFGPPRVVTRSEGNVLFELDGAPALPLYKDYLGELARELPSSALLFPLALLDGDGNEPLVRTILSVDEAKDALVFAGDVPQSAHVQLMRATHDGLIQGAARSAAGAAEPMPADRPWLGIAVSCVGRRLVLGQRSEEELEVILDRMPPHSALVGFYSYGEICPKDRGWAALHNQTMTLTLLTEVD